MLQLKVPLPNSNLSPADISLFEVWSHADCLSVELIGLLEPRLVGADQVSQVYVNIEVVGGHACCVLLPGDDLVREQNEISPHQRVVENRLSSIPQKQILFRSHLEIVTFMCEKVYLTCKIPVA